MKIVSWNIWGAKYLDRVVEFLKKAKADVIGLQEVLQEGHGNTAAYLAKLLDYDHVYSPALSYQEGNNDITIGNAVLSKDKIVANKIHHLSRQQDRIAVEAQIKTGNEFVNIFSTHLFHTCQKPSRIQEEQAKNLVRITNGRSSVLMGDFNALPESETIKIVSQHLINTDKNLLPTWSVYPEGCPICKPEGVKYKLDYMFISKDLKVKSFEVGTSKASDHLPISVIINV